MGEEKLVWAEEKLTSSVLAQRASANPTLLQDLLEAISPHPKKPADRYPAFLTLLALAEAHPEILLPHWDDLVMLLYSSSSPTQYNASHILVTLFPADRLGRIDSLLPRLIELMGSDNVPLVSHITSLLGPIARARPAQRETITRTLLHIDQICRDSKHLEMVKSYAIESFSQYFDQIELPAPVLAFVWGACGSSSGRTRKAAQTFLQRWTQTA
jgi:hypothetical protein